MTRDGFETQASQLIGHAVRRVRYFEIAYEEAEPLWCGDPRFDSLDHGLDLLTVSGECFQFSWGAEFYPYGVSLAAGFPEASDESFRVWDVTETSRWRDLLGKRIEDVRVFWSWVEGEDIGRVHYPQDLKLVFENGREVYISAFEVRGDGSSMGMMDHITVFFDEAVARQFGVGLETPD